MSETCLLPPILKIAYYSDMLLENGIFLFVSENIQKRGSVPMIVFSAWFKKVSGREKNWTGEFPHIQLKPFSPPVSPDAASLRINAGYELVDDRWGEVTRDFPPDRDPQVYLAWLEQHLLTSNLLPSFSSLA